MKYRAEIDGLRALAVIPVILFHAGIELFAGGFVGVDIFFVISGYLITSILIEDLEQGRFSIAYFWERRARRILPALFLVMAFCLPFAWLWMLPSQLKDFSQSLVAVSLFSSNILFWSESGYFAPEAEEKPLLHTWSLAVEEQYYLVFPLFLFLTWRFGKQRVFWIIVILATASLILSEWGWRKHPSANFYLAPSRAWEIFAGSIAAFIVHQRGVRANEPLSALGLALIIGSIFVFDETTPVPSLYLLAPIGGVVLLVLFGDKQTMTARLLGHKSLVGIGLISYSAYLWHQPLFAFARIKMEQEPSLALLLSLGLLALVMAYFSWKYVEVPARKAKLSTRGKRGLLAGVVLGLGVFGSIGALGHIQNGFSNRYTLPQVVQDQFHMPFRWNGYCFYSFNNRALEAGVEQVDCALGNGAETEPSILLFGDSFAAHWEPYFKALAQDHNRAVSAVTTNWCFPSARADYTAPRGHISRVQCDHNRAWVRDNLSQFDTVVLSASWDQLDRDDFAGGVTELVEFILANSAANVVVLDTPPQFRRSSVEAALYDPQKQMIVDEAVDHSSFKVMGQLKAALSSYDRVNIVDRGDLGFGASRGFKTEDGYPYSLDGGHISVYGATKLYEELSTQGRALSVLGLE